MDYMDPDVQCRQKADKLNLSLSLSALHFKNDNHISTPLLETYMYVSLVLLPNKMQMHLNKQICYYGVTVSWRHENLYEYITAYPSPELVT